MENQQSAYRGYSTAALIALVALLGLVVMSPNYQIMAAPDQRPNLDCAQTCQVIGGVLVCEYVCPPAATSAPPMPTIRATAAPPGGYYTTVCLPTAISDCPCTMGNYSNVTLYVTGSGTYIVSCGTCRGVCQATPTPRPQPTPIVQRPCNQLPQIGGGGLAQPCARQWPGYDLSVAVQIPPVQAARNPWPRALVGLPNDFKFVSAPDGVEKFSAVKALPCNVDRRDHEDSSFNCGNPNGDVGEGAQVNYQLGVAWRRYAGSDPGFGTQPPFISALVLEDRSWNNGNRLIQILPGQTIQHTYQTSSYGLSHDFPAWNPACQNRACSYAERTLPDQSVPAYSAVIQTWWWPEWTFRYDEYQCGHKVKVCVASVKSTDTCDGVAFQKEVRECDRWHWVNMTDPWMLYDARQQGLPLPYVGSNRTNFAGMNPGGVVQTPFDYPASVPVIEIQPVHP
jgi:hypothetical protein